MSSDSATPPSSVESSSDTTLRLKRRPIPRKGHTKSRGGCANCKKRKVKCDEVSPACGACRRLGYDCLYYENRLQVRPRREERSPSLAVVASGPPPMSLRIEPTWFSMDDMRFFQHFIFSAYPSLPLDGWDIWREVSQMAHQVCTVTHFIPAVMAKSHKRNSTIFSFTRCSDSARRIYPSSRQTHTQRRHCVIA